MDLIATFGLPVLISAVIAYLLGSISFAIPVTRLFTGKDIRTMGSGNAGFTNVLRCVSIPAAVITFIGDFAKGICSVFIGELVFNLMCGNVPDIEHVAQVGAGVASFPALFRIQGRQGRSDQRGHYLRSRLAQFSFAGGDFPHCPCHYQDRVKMFADSGGVLPDYHAAFQPDGLRFQRMAADDSDCRLFRRRVLYHSSRRCDRRDCGILPP